MCYITRLSNNLKLEHILKFQLRQFALVLHNLVTACATDQQISDEIEKDMCIVYRIVGICLGIPRHSFKWYYHDGTDQPCSYQIFTPLEFYERVVRPTFDLGDKVIDFDIFIDYIMRFKILIVKHKKHLHF